MEHILISHTKYQSCMHCGLSEEVIMLNKSMQKMWFLGHGHFSFQRAPFKHLCTGSIRCDIPTIWSETYESYFLSHKSLITHVTHDLWPWAATVHLGALY